ncbi:hypothetical protein H0H92_010488 [Tricholoma furcatifolium]|nr:hypothetical protein H0H92_010488 [Tricholoma furcatifolium]
MTSTLDACFQSASHTANKDLAERGDTLTRDSAAIADARARSRAEHAAGIYDALAPEPSGSTSTPFAETAPRVMQAFLAHGEACEQAEAEAMRLALNPNPGGPRARDYDDDDDEEEGWDAPLRVYTAMLETLDALYADAQRLEESIVDMTRPLRDSEPGLGSVKSESESASEYQLRARDGDTASGGATGDQDLGATPEGDNNTNSGNRISPTSAALGNQTDTATAPALALATPKASTSTSTSNSELQLDPKPDAHVHADADADADADTAQTQILRVFKACLPVLRARIANIAMAQDLVDGARENLSISLRMESLGLLGGDDEDDDEAGEDDDDDDEDEGEGGDE